MAQIDLFSFSTNKYKITKPIRLIEFFSGIGCQEIGIKRIFKDTTTYKTCEWAMNSIIAYDLVWHYQEPINCDLSKDQIVDYLYLKGVSLDYNKPATKEELKRKNIEELKHCYVSIIRNHNLVNICNVKGSDLEIVDKERCEYVLTYSFPCQDLSLAGKGKGMATTETRSGLVWEIIRILKELRERESLPQILLMENVPQVHGTKQKDEWWYLNECLVNLGYSNFARDMNAKNYGIPQNRDRTFMLSILGNYDYAFPEEKPLQITLKNMLESNVSEKYYLSKKMINYMEGNTKGVGNYNRKEIFNRNFKADKEVATCITTMNGQRPCDNFLKIELCDKLIEENRVKENDIIRHSYSKNRLVNLERVENKNNNLYSTLDTRCDCLGVVVPEKTKKGYSIAKEGDGIYTNRPQQKRGVVQKGMIQTIKANCDDIAVVVGTYQFSKSDNFMKGNDRFQKGKSIIDCQTTNQKEGIVEFGTYFTWKDKKGNINTQCNRACNENEASLVVPCENTPNVYEKQLRIRKLTPRECSRLMGLPDYVDTRLSGLSEAKRYHIYGDGLVPKIPELIFKKLLKEN